jgi:hypothetical protein
MSTPEIFMMIACDLIMIAAGYGAQLASTAEGIWPLFVLGCIAQAIVFAIQYAHFRAIEIEHDGRPESKCFSFLFLWSFTWWNFVTLVMFLQKLSLISYDMTSVLYMVGELNAKVVFGFVLVGSREALEGENTPLALLAMGLLGIDPDHRDEGLNRRGSVDVTQMQEIREMYHKPDPEEKEMHAQLQQIQQQLQQRQRQRAQQGSGAGGPPSHRLPQPLPLPLLQGPAQPGDVGAMLASLANNPAMLAQLSSAMNGRG